MACRLSGFQLKIGQRCDNKGRKLCVDTIEARNAHDILYKFDRNIKYCFCKICGKIGGRHQVMNGTASWTGIDAVDKKTTTKVDIGHEDNGTAESNSIVNCIPHQTIESHPLPWG
jgi:hypothetical protein